MTKFRKSVGGKRKSASSRRSPGVRPKAGVRPKGTRWFVLVAAIVGVAIVGIAVSRPFWGAGEALEDGAKRQLASRENSEEGPGSTAQLPVPDTATVPQELVPVPQEPVPVPPNSSASPLQPWGPVPTTVEESKKESLDTAQRLTEDYPHSAEALGVRASTLYRNGKTGEAAKWYNKCLEEDPNRADAWHILGIIALRKNQYEEGVRLFGKAEEIDPNLLAIYQDLATAYLEMGKPELAVAALERSLEKSPRRDSRCLFLGEAYSQLQEYEKAKENYLAATALKATSKPAYYGLASVYAKLGQPDKATECLEKFKELEVEGRRNYIQDKRADDPRKRARLPALAQTHTDAGRTYYGHGDLRKSEHHWQRAADVDPKNIFCRERLFNLYLANRRGDEALEVIGRLREIAPDNPRYHRTAGNLLTQVKQFQAAEEALGRAIELTPNDPAGYRLLAELLLRQTDRIQDARAISQKLIEMEPAAQNYRILAAVREKTGDSAGALAAIKTAVDLDPNNGEFRQIHEMLRAKQ